MSRRKPCDPAAVSDYAYWRQEADDARYARKALDALRERTWTRRGRVNVDAGPKVPEGSWERGALERQVLRYVLRHGHVPEARAVKKLEQRAKDCKPALKGVPLVELSFTECAVPA